MNKVHFAYWTAFLAVIAFVVVMLPGAQAQASEANVQIQSTDTNVLVTPFGQPQSRQLNVFLEYTVGAVQPTTSVRVDASISGQPSWLTVTVSPTTALFTVPPEAAGGQGETSPQAFNVIFSATGDAPAIRPTEVSVAFTPTAGTGDLNTNPNSVSFTVTADYYSIVGLQLPSPFLRVAPTDTATFPLTITNDGNGDTLFTFEITQVGNEKWQVPVPSQITVPSTQSGAESNQRQVPFQVTTALGTQYYNDIGVVTARVSPFFAPQPEKTGVPTSVSFLAHFQGVYVPGFEAAALVTAIGASALLVRRRKIG